MWKYYEELLFFVIFFLHGFLVLFDMKLLWLYRKNKITLAKGDGPLLFSVRKE